VIEELIFEGRNMLVRRYALTALIAMLALAPQSLRALSAAGATPEPAVGETQDAQCLTI